jgi:hypothetical protein
MHSQSQLYTGVAALVAAAFVVRRTLRPQTVRVWGLIAAPVLLFIVACAIVVHAPPTSAIGVGIIATGAIGGAALGYARALHSRVTLGPRPGTLVVAGNGILVAILLAAFAARLLIRAASGNAGSLSLALSDAFLIFGVTSVGVARGMLFFTWRRLTGAQRNSTGMR